ncbi:MAG TPA: PQQ-dependent sugar dehydrogenase [Melioribacteraceae bacterium]|nr:PQQ-dependent sugar dehydrogenase [Melioribacteraceae bacterium]
MKRLLYLSIASIILITGCKPSNAQVQIMPAFPNLSFEQPVDIQYPDDGTNRLFVVSQPGVIYLFENNNDVRTKKVFLDIRDKVLFGGEQGLLGLAFHPDYRNNGFFYINYTTSNPRRTVVSRFRVSQSDPDAADRSSELILLQADQPYSNHNGGQTSFGPDGYLYISLGDGGSGGDPQNNAQNLKSLLGKILRIDVNNTSGGLNYSIPDDNPLKGNSNGLKEEIYAWGLRNVWKFSFDPEDSRLWAADVGQNAWEEINIIAKGQNYGWRIMEGNHCFNPPSNCNTANLTLPVWEYGHNDQGGYSITGGYVYQGSSVPELKGKYIYGDFVSGRIWALDFKSGTVSNELLFSTNHAISTFGLDQNKTLYFANYTTGRLYKFTSTSASVGALSLPPDYKLYQNYPNPFNPSTRITYQIPDEGDVTLKVYDSLGTEIATLVDENKSPGFHSVLFDSNNLKSRSSIASGVYFYNLSFINKFDSFAGKYSQTRKFILMK